MVSTLKEGLSLIDSNLSQHNNCSEDITMVGDFSFLAAEDLLQDFLLCVGTL
jgi:hypothetical protein